MKTDTIRVLKAKEKRRTIWEMRKRNCDWPEIGEALGLSEKTCQHYLEAAYKLDGLERLMVKRARVDVKDEEAVSMVLTAASDPFDDKYRELRAVCKEAGMKPSLVAGIIRRMKSQFAAPLEEMKKLTLKEMTDQIESKISLVLSAMDEYSVAQASLKDQSIALGILVDRHQLLNNRPTQIFDHTSRLEVQQLAPLLLAEANRRGLVIDMGMAEVVQ